MAHDQVRAEALKKRPRVFVTGPLLEGSTGPNIFEEARITLQLLQRGYLAMPGTLIVDCMHSRFPQSSEALSIYASQLATRSDVVLRRPGHSIMADTVTSVARFAGVPVISNLNEVESVVPLPVDASPLPVENPFAPLVWRSAPSDLTIADNAVVETYSAKAIALHQTKPLIGYLAGPYSRDPGQGTQVAFAATVLSLGKCNLWPPHWTHLLDCIAKQPYLLWLAIDAGMLPRNDFGLRIPGPSSGADGELDILKELDTPVHMDVNEFFAKCPASSFAVNTELASAAFTQYLDRLSRDEVWPVKSL